VPGGCLSSVFRCLRDTYATWHCIAGLDVHKLMRRMGHAKVDQTIAYAKAAETVQSVGVPFGALPFSVIPSVTDSKEVALTSVKASGRDRGRTCDSRCVKAELYH
jgi:hypothetical protein